jgi:hypothetical protein
MVTLKEEVGVREKVTRAVSLWVVLLQIQIQVEKKEEIETVHFLHQHEILHQSSLYYK